jgi:hypothetical protein
MINFCPSLSQALIVAATFPFATSALALARLS